LDDYLIDDQMYNINSVVAIFWVCAFWKYE